VSRGVCFHRQSRRTEWNAAGSKSAELAAEIGADAEKRRTATLKSEAPVFELL
jgi:hypothetical protein